MPKDTTARGGRSTSGTTRSGRSGSGTTRSGRSRCGTTRSGRRGSWPAIAALILALVVSAACSVCGCGEDAAEPVTAPVDQAKDLAAKAAVLAIATGVKAHVATTGEAPVDASQATLGGFVSPWPENPFTGAPMQAGSSAGDYVYRALGGASYELSVHLSDGSLSPAP